MSFKDFFSSPIKTYLTAEEEILLYEKAGDDIEKGIINKGIWTKAYSQAQGDEAKQKAIYIKLIVAHYVKEIQAGEELAYILASAAEKVKKDEERRKAAAEAAEERARRNATSYAYDPQRDMEEARKQAQESHRRDKEKFKKEQEERDRKLREEYRK
tara:strand:- start:74 stop:544 length:471 start_codon:yes stop_codon:yes gene_type:complete